MNITNNHNFNKNVNFKLKFNGYENIQEFYSQAGQDIFVLSILNGKKNGFFLDIGCAFPKLINNTFLLEDKFDWDGILIDYDENLINECKLNRKSKTIYADATQVDYEKIFNEYMNINYISLDIDGINTLNVLKKLPLSTHQVDIITFEHDVFRGEEGVLVRSESRKILDKLNYIRICSDVSNEYNIYEDWYINKNILNNNILELFKNNNAEWSDILFE